MIRFVCALFSVLALLGASAPAQLIKVPASFPTISAALQAATSGQTILVEGGVYTENITWPSVDGIRLVGDNAVIDGGRNGTVITVGPGLTRATLIRGFRITGGFAKDGAGLRLQSPITVRDNTIIGCEGADGTLNRGGGIFVANGVSPRIVGNTITGNMLKTGATNQGAGIYVGGSSRAEIVGNRLDGNSCQGPGSSYGAGIYFDPSGIPSPILRDNLIVLNTNQGTTLASGGGVYVDGGTVEIVGNTIADNTCTSTTRATGGGVGFGTTNGASSPMVNNLVVTNRCTGAVQIGGGVHCNGANIFFDFNDVWQNAPDDYFGCAPGLNDVSVDPKFTSLTYQLSSTSPLIDAGDNAAVSVRSGADFEGDPRLLNGDRAGNARVDIGADEFSSTGLQVSGGIGIGLDFSVSSATPLPYGLAISTARTNVVVQPFGSLLIANPIVIGGGTAPGQTRLAIPLVPALEGLEVHAQALVYQTTAPFVGEFTERASVTLTTPFGRPIVETFATRRQFDTGDASWGRGNGLTATFGFGGTGADGSLIVTRNLVLDGDTRPAGMYAEWDFQNLTVQSGVTLSFIGGRSVRLRVAGNCVIDGTIDISGQNGNNAMPGNAVMVGLIPGGAGGVGAGKGGDSNPKPNDPVGALPYDLRGGPGWPRATICTQLNRSANRLVTVVEPNCGGGTGGNRGRPSGLTLRRGCSGNGGGHFGDGEQTDFLCGLISSFGREFGRLWVVRTGPSAVPGPTSGTGGGGGGNTAISTTNPAPRNDIVAGSGGGGGGGLEISALGSVTVRGDILSNGGSGGVGHTTVINNVTVSGGYGGGGSGGSIWLTGTAVTVDDSAVLSAVGGIGNPAPPNPPRTGNGGPGYIIARDLSGTPTIGMNASINPPVVAGRLQLSTPGTSSATSKWYTATVQMPAWAFNASNPQTGVVIPGSDLVFSTQPTANQTVMISFQGAPDLNGRPNPNPSTWVPANNFTTNIAQLANLRHIRYKIDFDLGPIQGSPLPSAAAISRLTLRY